MAAQPITTLSSTLPLSSDRSTFISKPLSTTTPTFPKSFKPNPKKNNFTSSNSIVCLAAGEPRGDLDHLQRVVAKPQSQPKRRVESVSVPIGSLDRFPTARTVQQMMETMERLMEDPLAYTSAYPPPAPTQNGSYSRGRTPWEIKEGEADYKMRFDMPGMTKDDVKVWVEEKMLVVQAEKAPKKKQGGVADGNVVNGNGAGAVNGGVNSVGVVEEEDEEWPAKSYGRYKSRILLPENIQFERIKAEVKDGVLYITVPKASVTAKVLDIAVQ